MKPEELAKQFEPSAQAIRKWVAQADRDASKRSDGLTSAEREELVRLRRENKPLQLERDILSRATARVSLGRPTRSRRHQHSAIARPGASGPLTTCA